MSVGSVVRHILACSFCTSEVASSPPPTAASSPPLLKSCQIVGVFWDGFVRRDPEGSARNERALFALYATGALRPRISARFPLEAAGAAIAALADRRAMGRVAVTMG